MYLKFIMLLFLVHAQAEQCTTPNNQPGECILLSSCTVLYEALRAIPETCVEEFVQKSICGGTKFIPMVCCGTSSNFTPPKLNISKPNPNRFVTKTDLLPSRKYCGYQHSDDYFRTENDTSVRINEFPWLARIIQAHTGNGFAAFSVCAGSLINTRYVLTSAFCVDQKVYPIISVRLGEFNNKNDTDCVEEPPFEQECTRFEDFGIEKTIRHPNYSTVNDNNNIALLRLNRTVMYTDYIRPICLPTPETIRAKFGDILTSSGWESYYTSLIDHKQKFLIKLISREECIENLNARNFPRVSDELTENDICVVQQGNQSEKCNNSFGGPIMFSYRFQWHQEAIVYSTLSCKKIGMSDVHTSLTNYVEWIKECLEA